jgi:hypothetical protein
MLRLIAVVFFAQAVFAFPGSHQGWHSSSPQPIVNVDVPSSAQLPIFSVQAPAARVQEAIPQPIYSLQTNVRQPIMGQSSVLPQQTLQLGQSAQQAITSMTRPQMVREVQGKNMPILSGPAAETLAVQELSPQHEQYAVKATEQQKETEQETVTQQVFAPYLQRILRHQVPVRHINVNRFIQPIVNREVQPVLETQVQEGPAAPARIASKKNMGGGETPAQPEAPAAPEAPLTPETSATGNFQPASTPSATPSSSEAPFRTTMYRPGAIREAVASRLAAATPEATPTAQSDFALRY